jgi:phage gp36-like protein
MSYATQANLTSLDLPAAALAGMTAAGVDPDEHLDAAAAKIDTYLRGRVTLPLGTPYPAEIISLNSALAAYSMLSVRGFDPQNGTDMNVRQRYEDAVAWLVAFSAGKVNLAEAADATPAAYEGAPIVASRCRTDWRFRR